MEDLKPAHQYIIVPAGMPYFFKEKLKVSNLKDFLEQELTSILWRIFLYFAFNYIVKNYYEKAAF